MTIPPATKKRDNSRDDARIILARHAEAWRGDAEMPPLKDPVSISFWISVDGGPAVLNFHDSIFVLFVSKKLFRR